MAKILLSPESIGIGSDRLVHAPQPNNERVIFEKPIDYVELSDLSGESELAY